MIKSISEVKAGDRFDYGIFRGVLIKEITPTEVIFSDKFCNERRLTIHNFLMSAENVKKGVIGLVAEPEPKKEEKPAPAKKVKKEAVPEKVKEEKPEVKKDKKEKKAPVQEKKEEAKPAKKQTGGAPAGWITAMAAAKKHNKPPITMRQLWTKGKIQAKQFPSGNRESVWFVKESDVDKIYGK